MITFHFLSVQSITITQKSVIDYNLRLPLSHVCVQLSLYYDLMEVARVRGRPKTIGTADLKPTCYMLLGR